jgi:hypothetical protein
VRTLKNSGVFLEPYCSWWGSMRRLRRNHQKQSTIDWLEEAPGAAPASRCRAAPGLACVPWAPTPASQHRATSGAPRVPMAPGRMKTVEPSSTENRAPNNFFSTRLSAQGSSGGSACPRGSGPNENRQADAEDLAEPGRCKATPIRSKRNRA